ncbi:AhpC/TSA family protein [Filimonas lacunae]|uniref:AhpC/TSA family protein n=1 Tax=Filimonas lacunae TaxID=477680 RepID=A0A173MLV8_9BACT|nr:redoxin domain-containing protein [Filimonas lacunae]BAV08622.1 hypothetical protein FLA_4668 [Filimonas lacunae]SIS58656.1 AhpC/TSA family protein [Filimonas lacunae]
MQKIILAFLLLFVSHSFVNAQAYDTTAQYKKHPGLPVFQILQSDSTWFTDAQLPKDRPIVIIYFSPECGHCQTEAEDLVKHMEQLKSAFFVMVSFHSPADIGKFAEKYKLANLDNVRLGRDVQYYLPTFYHVQYTPFIAVYDKKRQLLKTFEMGAGFEKLNPLINGK